MVDVCGGDVGCGGMWVWPYSRRIQLWGTGGTAGWPGAAATAIDETEAVESVFSDGGRGERALPGGRRTGEVWTAHQQWTGWEEGWTMTKFICLQPSWPTACLQKGAYSRIGS